MNNLHDLEERLDWMDHCDYHNRRNSSQSRVDWWYVGAWCGWVAAAIAAVALWCVAYWKC